MPLEFAVLESAEALAARLAEWDALAVACRRPTCAPGWGMAWWRHAAPRGAGLRAVVVTEGDRLVGIAPFYYARRSPSGIVEYGLLAGPITARVEPLAEPGREAEVARAVVAALAAVRPRPALVRFAGVPVGSPWLEHLRRGWPSDRAARVHADPPIPAPTVTLGAEDVDAYLKSRSSNFRQQMRRARRKLEKEGAVFRTAATPEEIDRDLDAFERLHNARWEHRGGSAALVEGVDAMLRQAGRDLLEDGRLRLDSIDVGGRTVSSQLYLAAGGEVTYWLGGFDDDFGSYKPALVALVEAIADSLRRGDDRFDLGPGDQDYKYRLADGKEELAWVTLVPPGPAHLLGRAALAPTQARRALAARLPDDARERVKKLLRR